MSFQSTSRRYALAVYRIVGLPLILLAAVILPFFTQDLPLLRTVEAAIYDRYRFHVAEEIQGIVPEIALLLYDEETARATQQISPVNRSILAKALRDVDEARAKSVAVDMVFAQTTDDEQELIDTINAMTIPTYIVFADPEGDQTLYWKPESDFDASTAQESFWERITNPLVQKVSPVVGVDEAGVARHWPQLGSNSNPLLSAAMAGQGEELRSYSGSIAYTKSDPSEEGCEGRVARCMWYSSPIIYLADEEMADFREGILLDLEDTHVLIGGDTFNSDQKPTPITRVAGEFEIPGVMVHAQMLHQALRDDFPAPLPWFAVLGLALLFMAAGAATAKIERRPILLLGAVLLQAALAVALPLGMYRMGVDLLSIPMFGLVIAWLLSFLAVGYALRTRSSTERAFARGTLGKYLPENVAKEILADPEKLELEGEERNLFLMFTDLQGFTSFSHGRAARDTAAILNRYLEEMSAVVLKHRGTIDKYVGDAVVAFWGAPLINPKDGENAVRCTMAMFEASEKLREEIAKEYGDTLGRTRIGLHYGPVIVGNFGGKQRIQYTALGDAMNIAARLEGANKYTGSDIMVSRAVVEQVPDFTYRKLGRIQMSGVATGIEVLEPIRDDRQGYTDELNAAMDLLEAGEAQAQETLRELGRTYPDDRAIEALVERADAIAGGKPYVLGSK